MPQSVFERYTVADAHAGLPLSAALKRLRPELSWSQVRRLIANRHVEIGDNLCVDEGRKLNAGESLKVWRQPRRPAPHDADVKIRYLDAHLVVVEKPAGMITLRHAAQRLLPQRRRDAQPTLDEAVRRALVRRLGIRGPADAGRRRAVTALRAVHRLDRDTSGLMLFARTVAAQRVLVQMFRKHELHRVYLAIVHGHVTAQTFTSSLVRDRGDGRRGSTHLPEVGKRAVTHVRPLEHLDGYTLLECRLETGRTHQIRIHLAEAGHFVCGEKVYRQRLHGQPLEDRSGAQRQALHAAELGFTHPITGQPLRFEMPLPADMGRLLVKLRGKK